MIFRLFNIVDYKLEFKIRFASQFHLNRLYFTKSFLTNYFEKTFLKVNQTFEEAIIELHLAKFSPRKIRARLGVGFGRIRNTIEFYECYHKIPDPKRPGRPSKAAENTLAAIEALTVSNRMISSADISQHFRNNNIQLSTTSVWRYRHQLNYNFRPPKRRQALNSFQMDNRLQFSHSIRK